MKILLLLLSLALVAPGRAQQKDNTPLKEISDLPQDTLPASYHILIRDLQFEQDKLLLQLRDLKLQEDQLQTRINALNDEISQEAYKAAIEKKMDVKVYVLDLDHLYWVKRKDQPK